MVNTYQKMTSCWAANHTYKHKVANKEIKTKNLYDCSPSFACPQRFNYEPLNESSCCTCKYPLAQTTGRHHTCCTEIASLPSQRAWISTALQQKMCFSMHFISFQKIIIANFVLSLFLLQRCREFFLLTTC